MTITVPKWLLIAAIVVGVGVAAFAIGRSTSDSDQSGSGATAISDSEPLPCNETAAERATERSEFAEDFEPDEIAQFFQLDVAGCSDLNGDGLDEMVVAIHGPTGSSVAPTTIYSQQKTRWEPEIVRILSNNDSVRVTSEGVRETTAAYGPSEPSCCPSGERMGLVSWNGERYVYEPAAGIGDGRVRISDSAVVSIGPFQVQTGSPVAAIDAFGVPSSYSDTGESCEMTWKDTGLSITFVDLGSSNACGESGLVGSAMLAGDHAEQTGWTVGDGLDVGSTQDDVRGEYPAMQPLPFYSGEDRRGPEGRDWSLVTRPNPYGAGQTPSLTVRLNRGDAVAYTALVGAGGSDDRRFGSPRRVALLDAVGPGDSGQERRVPGFDDGPDAADEMIYQYCAYGAVSQAQLNGFRDHAKFREILLSLDTNAAMYARGEISDCHWDAGPFC